MATNVRVEYASGGSDTFPYIQSEESYHFNKMWTWEITVARQEITGLGLEENQDEVYLVVDGTDIFGGLLRDVTRKGEAISKLIVDSFEAYARDAEPTSTAYSFDNVADTVVVNDAITNVPQLTAGTIENVKSSLTFEFNHQSRARVIRVVRDATGAEIAYNADKTVDYVATLGSDKTDQLISPSRQNVEAFRVTRNSGGEQVNHLRMLGGGSGDAQTVVEVVAPNYDAGTDREIWTAHANREISNSDTLREQGNELIAEMQNPHIEVEATIRDLDVSLGDDFYVRYPEEDVDTTLRVVELTVIRSADGTSYEATLSNRNQARINHSSKIAEDVERFNREGGGRVVSTYDDPTLAPQEEGNIIYVTGSNASYERGLYYHNGTAYEGTQYPDVQADNVQASQSLVLPTGTSAQDLFVLPVGVDQYKTT